MANWYLLNNEESAVMFKEITGTLGLECSYGRVAQVVYYHANDGRAAPLRPLLTPPQLNVVGQGLQDSVIASLGLFGFVYPYERYKKIANRYPDRDLDPSVAFGFGNFSNRATFQAAYPNAVIHTWQPGPRNTWFADCVRNSFAHAQSTTVVEGHQLMLSLVNATDGLDPNFVVSMLPMDFETLVKTGLRNFLQTVVYGGVYQPLSLLLQ